MIKKMLLAGAIAMAGIGLLGSGAAQAGVYGVPYAAYDLYPPYGVFPPFRFEPQAPQCHREFDKVPTRHGWRTRAVTVCTPAGR